MSNLFKIILAGLVAFGCVLFFGVYWYLNWGHTINREGKFRLDGLQAEVEVFTDNYGVAHINAQNDHDMMMTLGYITASDRLWQMDLLRRISARRLSEILGPELLDTDIFLRKMRLRSHMAEVWPKFLKTAPPPMMMQIEAYFKGVNAYVKNGPRPLEMKLLNYDPDEFDIVDSLGVAGYMSLSFAESLFIDPLYTDLLRQLPQNEVDLIFPRAALDDLLPDVSLGKKTDEAVPSASLNEKTLNNRIKIPTHSSNEDRSFNFEELKKTPVKKMSEKTKVSLEYYKHINKVLTQLKDRFGMFQGSNAWVLSPNRSKSGKTLLASDPHIAYSSPSVFYEVHIKSPTYENYGHYIPLIPFPGLGHNQDRGWGITMSNSDELDFYIEKFHPTEKKVMFNNEYVDYRVVKEEIKIKGKKEPHVEEVIITPHGPVIDGTKYVKKGDPISIKWQFLNETNNPALSFYLLSQSKELKDLAPALSHTAAPGFNIIFADSKGNIGWHVMGKIPVLKRQSNGRAMMEGHSGEDEYVRYLDIMENPHIYNPENGVIVSANYKHLVEGPIPWIGMWQPKDRVLRLEALISQQEKWSAEELKALQTDEHVTFCKSFIEDFLSEVDAKTELEKTILEIMNKWDGSSQRKNIESSVYYVISHMLLKNILEDEMGETRFQTYAGGADGFAFLFHILKKKDSVLWDNIKTTDVKETAKQIINQTYKDSITYLYDTYGSNYERWYWEKLQHVEFKHVLGKFFPLNKIFNLGPYSVAGGTNQVNSMGAVKGNLNFDVFYGPATRRLVDFADTTTSYGVLPTGNSGHRSSSHYSDQVDLLVNNQYRTQNMNFDRLDQPVKKLVLRPKKHLKLPKLKARKSKESV